MPSRKQRQPGGQPQRKHRSLSRRERLLLVRAAVTGVAQGATRALFDVFLTGH